jgi:hypothetical protein
MMGRRFSVSPTTAIAVLALFLALGGGSAFAVTDATSRPEQQREVARARSQHSFDEALNAAAERVPKSLRGRTRLGVTFQVRVSNPHIAEYYAIISTTG